MSPGPPRRRLVAAVVVAALCLVIAVHATAAAPPPRSVCEPCHEDLEYAAEREGIALDVTDSVGTIRVHRNGSATWTVTSRYEPGTYEGDPDARRRNLSALAEDRDLARDVALRAIGEFHGSNADVDRLRSVRANASAITFTYRHPDVARQSVGGLRFDHYHTGGYGSGWYVDVTRLRIVGPNGSVLGNDAVGAIGPEIATARDGVLTIRGDTENPPTLQRDDVYVAFAPPGVAGSLLARLGILLATLPTVVGAFQVIHLPGLAVLVGVLGVVRWRRSGADDASDRRIGWRRVAISVVAYLVVGVLLRPPTAPPGMFWILPAAVLVGIGLAIGIVNWITTGFSWTTAE